MCCCVHIAALAGGSVATSVSGKTKFRERERGRRASERAKTRTLCLLSQTINGVAKCFHSRFVIS